MSKQKALSTRIKSVRSIQKTTRVMQMISASKFRAARENLGYSRGYCEALLREIVRHGYKNERGKAEASGTLLIVFSSDRGLCGGYNYSVSKFLREYLKTVKSEEKMSFFFVGRKVYDMTKSTVGDYGEVRGVVTQPRNTGFCSFKEFLYDLDIDFMGFQNVKALYSKFHTISSHEQVVENILLAGGSDLESAKPAGTNRENLICGYDPDFTSISKRIWFNSFVAKFYLSLCESVTCEHCCRMMSMESANSNTQSMLSNLVLEYNRSRQASITTDLIEVVSGCEAAVNA
ncbi:MAG: FoF1 ATP synthase subunit gamma [Aaplasma endosymbiont of Hyalomma asiaticum]